MCTDARSQTDVLNMDFPRSMDFVRKMDLSVLPFRTMLAMRAREENVFGAGIARAVSLQAQDRLASRFCTAACKQRSRGANEPGALATNLSKRPARRGAFDTPRSASARSDVSAVRDRTMPGRHRSWQGCSRQPNSHRISAKVVLVPDLFSSSGGYRAVAKDKAGRTRQRVHNSLRN